MPTTHINNPASATTQTTGATIASAEMEQQRMLLGREEPVAAAADTTATLTSRLAAPAAATAARPSYNHNNNCSSKDRPRYAVKLMPLLHIASYVLCLCAFSFALYANVRQTRLEQRVQRLQQLDARIVELELRLEQQQLIHWPAEQAQLLASAGSKDNVSGSPHLALHVRRELHRLRRDVSQLQLTRRQQRRQAAEAEAAAAAVGGVSGIGANGECQCQTGESKSQL